MAIVKVFTTETCPYCFALKDWLHDQNVDFDEINANEVPGISAVPVTQVGEDGPFIGFDQANITKALQKNGLV